MEITRETTETHRRLNPEGDLFKAELINIMLIAKSKEVDELKEHVKDLESDIRHVHKITHEHSVMKAKLAHYEDNVVAEFSASLSIFNNKIENRIVIHKAKGIDLAFAGSTLGGKKYEVIVMEIK